MTHNITQLPGTTPTHHGDDFHSSHDVANQADISYRQLDYWTRTGLLTAYPGRHGNGYVRHYDTEERDRAVIMAALVRDGVAPRAAHRIANDLLTSGESTVGGFTLTQPPPQEDQ